MILEHIAISGFRGISQLSLPLEQGNVLIGENTWGKSTLLDALTLLLTPAETLYQFVPQDFHSPSGAAEDRRQRLSVEFTFRESEVDEARTPRLLPLAALWHQSTQGYSQLVCRVEGVRVNDRPVKTRWHFPLSEAGPAGADEQTILATMLTRLQPVLRLRDARFSQRLSPQARNTPNDNELASLVSQIDELTRDLTSRPQRLAQPAIRQGLQTMQQLLEHYFSVQPSARLTPAERSDPARRQSPKGWRYLDSLNHLIAAADSESRQLILLRMFALLVQARGAYQLDPLARPLLLIEDPETRLHPIMLSVAWGLLTLLPLQKITTTNSGELLSQVPVGDVCRLIRQENRVDVWRLGPSGMSADESRRIAFHICVNRPSALFARCWLLVEGETEVWVMNELARQCGCHFAAEGIKVVEFAQSGLRPLLKFAQRMGIEWHVLTDGDEAGNKYAATAKSQLRSGSPDERDRLTQLPALDMEHFLYKQGFAEVYHRTARLPSKVPMNMRRIIAKAIQHSSKPELAVAVATEAAERGVASVPPLLREMFHRLQELARRSGA
ncbi:ATP-dependent endonuclease [Erwinia sp. P6884]|uniref:ATP-dependent endonuclease n=1 Tax=Erwinia sp. P6884 TaxID=3141450 RepID=UPI0031912D6B